MVYGDRYQARPITVDAMQFDGTSTGVERVIAWAGVVAPGHPIRPRTEYKGWADLVGYLELEVPDSEVGCMAGDWAIVTSVGGRTSIWFAADDFFRKYFIRIGK